MSDPIDRQAAIDEAEEWIDAVYCDYDEQRERDAIRHVINGIKELPSAQPDVPDADGDMISRKLMCDLGATCIARRDDDGKLIALGRIDMLPSAQPEIVRCKDCKYAEVADPEDSQDGYTCQFHRGSIWFSGSFCSWAERREE